MIWRNNCLDRVSQDGVITALDLTSTFLRDQICLVYGFPPACSEAPRLLIDRPSPANASPSTGRAGWDRSVTVAGGGLGVPATTTAAAVYLHSGPR
ncbi:hypothetical protein BV898_14310 [Hypsibius exemplaris]|uniref:Uncharacterized protein n=1 Tax=Hypsibius exemplaris TaxID=2072580 RepID=A0A9X6RJ84_HYPEX|nr:hypothetical protein BV898_14310 [Hypsibius exemplaris]